MPLNRYKIILEYCGTGFIGWQKQKCAHHGVSIQGVVEDAVYKFSGEYTNVIAAGRTDAGVHAYAQVAHFDLEKYYAPERVISAINHFMRSYDVAVYDCSIATYPFHARFSATHRHYIYKVLNRSVRSAIYHDKYLLVKSSLSLELMQEASKFLVGQHDFTSFRSSHCNSLSPVKNISNIQIYREGDKVIFAVSAISFLHHMVRNIVGTLLLVGMQKWQPYDVYLALMAKNRSGAGPTAPPHGLYLTRVDYGLL